MATIEYGGAEMTSAPVWAGDFFDREHVLPGGARLDAAAFAADGTGRKLVVSGTLVGRTYTERAAGAAFGPAADTDNEVFVVVFDVDDAARNPDVDLYRPGSVLREDRLPGFGGLSAALQGKVRSAYVTIIGATR